jgi:hypothetical protein
MILQENTYYLLMDFGQFFDSFSLESKLPFRSMVEVFINQPTKNFAILLSDTRDYITHGHGGITIST